MFTYMCTHVTIYMHMCWYIYTCTYTCTYTHPCAYTYAYTEGGREGGGSHNAFAWCPLICTPASCIWHTQSASIEHEKAQLSEMV